jgi:drug/metabolite transporter (DMT)-like permease
VPRSLAPVALVVVTGLGWGLLAVACKALFAAEPSVFNGTTVALARGLWALPFFAIGLSIAWRFGPPKLDAPRWLLIVAAGIVFGPGVSLLYSLAAQETSVAHITFLLGVSPVTNTAAAALAFRHPLDRRAWLALALGIVGIVLLAVTRRAEGASVVGDLLMLGWLATFAVYACLLRAVGTRVPSTLLMCLVGTIAMVALVIPGLALGGLAAAVHVVDTPPVAWWFFGEIIIGSTLIAQTTYAAAVRWLGVGIATIGTEYTALVVGIVASLLAREAWTPLTGLAAVAFCAALAVTFVPSGRRRPARRCG